MPGSQLSRSPEIAAIKHTDTANHHHWHLLLLLLLLVLVVAASLSLSRVTPPLETKQNSFFLIFGNFLLRLFSLFPAHFERPQCDDVRRFSRRGDEDVVRATLKSCLAFSHRSIDGCLGSRKKEKRCNGDS